ncbi:unnamed protein product [Penicillium salamii]|uniref:Uncharacterized protein n=1 Tax=Penicillium salamii TaxID=1612424 RepID=A0A9W4N1F1_9EURO|nr:unnamed protein product [Penicillium salamii]CAG8272151.1 unnamed protein product [Penicillium salamii]CAG8379771.1 unnamed protein product [Penicillium salamii]CAG8380593.1 unnamed protein product [Penicillium salamii]
MTRLQQLCGCIGKLCCGSCSSSSEEEGIRLGNRRTATQAGPAAPSAAPPAAPPATTAPLTGDALNAKYRADWQRYQSWIENANAPGCAIKPVTLTMKELKKTHRVVDYEAHNFMQPLQGGDLDSTDIEKTFSKYHRFEVEPLGEQVIQSEEVKQWECVGAIIADSVFKNGHHWNEIATTLYEDHLKESITTLKHVIFMNVVNPQTFGYCRDVLYPRKGVAWATAGGKPCLKLERGTPEYEEILGTQLGKSVACLVISGFPRGTKRIRRVVTWTAAENNHLYVRFEIADSAP